MTSIVAILDEKIAEVKAASIIPRFILLRANALTALVKELAGAGEAALVDLDRLRPDGLWMYKDIEIVVCEALPRLDPFFVCGNVADELAVFQLRTAVKS